jgi:hypothetical protein
MSINTCPFFYLENVLYCIVFRFTNNKQQITIELI